MNHHLLRSAHSATHLKVVCLHANGVVVSSASADRMAVMEPRSHLFFDRLPQSSGGRVELVLELRHVPARYSTDHRHFRLTHRRHDPRRDDGTVNPRDRRSDQRSSIPQPICGTPRSAEHAACLTWHIVIRSIGKEPLGSLFSCDHQRSLEPLNDVKTTSGSARRSLSALSRYGCIAERAA